MTNESNNHEKAIPKEQKNESHDSSLKGQQHEAQLFKVVIDGVSDHTKSHLDKIQETKEKRAKGSVLGPISRAFGCSLQIESAADNTVIVKGRSSKEVEQALSAEAKARQANAYAQKYSEDPNKPLGEAKHSEKSLSHSGSDSINRAGEKTASAQELKQLEQRLENWATHNLIKSEQDQFKENMKSFESRLGGSPQGRQELFKTFNQIERMIKEGNLKFLKGGEAGDKQEIICQVMNNCARPTDVDQGQHKTCASAALEARIYTRTPSEAAALVADVLCKGSFKARDKSGASVDYTKNALVKDREADSNGPSERTLASEIFQVTAVKLNYDIYNRKHHDDKSYEQTETSEVLKDGNKVIGDSPQMQPRDTAEVSKAITGRSENVALVLAKESEGEGVITAADLPALRKSLNDIEKSKNFPVIIRVNTALEPFFTDNPSENAGSVGHAVTITGIDRSDPANPLVFIDGQWGNANDHISKGIRLSDLYPAMMMNKQDAANEVSKQIKEDERYNKFDPLKHLELARLNLMEHKIDAGRFEKELGDIMDHVKGRNYQAENKWTFRYSVEKFLPLDAQIRLQTRMQDCGINSHSGFVNGLKEIAEKISNHFKERQVMDLNLDQFNPFSPYKVAEKQMEQALNDQRNKVSDRERQEILDLMHKR